MKFDVTSEEHVRCAIDMAHDSTECSGFHAGEGDDDLSPVDLEAMRAKGSGPLWYAWSGQKADSLAVAITGNGPTSKANAKFFSCAREMVLALAAEVQRLRADAVAAPFGHGVMAERARVARIAARDAALAAPMPSKAVTDFLNDPDWPLAMSALTEANGYDVDKIVVAPDVWKALDALPRGEGRVPWESSLNLRVYRDHNLAEGDGFAILRNGSVRRLCGKSEPSSSDGKQGGST